MDHGKLRVLMLLTVFYAPIFSGLVDSWTIDPFYSHGFLVPVISAYLAWRLRGKIAASDRDFLPGATVMAAGLGAYAVGLLYKSLFLSAASFLLVLSGYVVAFHGRKTYRKLLFPIGFLVFMIPLPYVDYISTDLQGITASAAAGLLNAAGFAVEAVGSQLQVSDMAFVIGEPCSGLRTMLALFALAALYAYLVEGGYGRKVLLFAFALPIAIAANVARVVSIIVVAAFYGQDAAMSYFHGFSGFLVYGLSFIMLIIVGRCLGCKGLRNI